MSPLLAPLLAQAISLQLGDRTEARYVNFNGGERYEGSNAPLVGLSVSGRRTQAQASYAPGITLAPLETRPRQLYVFHQVGASVTHALRRTTFKVGSSLGIGSLNLRFVGLQGLQPVTGAPSFQPPTIGAPTIGTPPAGTPPADNATTGTPTTGTPTTGTPTTGTPTTGTPTTGTPTTGTPPGGAVTNQAAQDQRVRFYIWTGAVEVGHRLSKRLQVSGVVGTSLASGRDEESRRFYQTLHAWTVGGGLGYTQPLSKDDNLTGNSALANTWSSNGNESSTLNTTVTYNHRFSVRTAGTGGAGLNITRFKLATGLAGFSIFPTANLGLAHTVRLGRSRNLTFTCSAFSSPFLDPLRAIVDPRIGVTGSVAFNDKKFFAATSGTVALSVADSNNSGNAVNSANADARVGYQVGRYASLDTGLRVARQTYGGANVIPTSWGAYAGVTIGYNAVLSGPRPPTAR